MNQLKTRRLRRADRFGDKLQKEFSRLLSDYYVFEDEIMLRAAEAAKGDYIVIEDDIILMRSGNTIKDDVLPKDEIYDLYGDVLEEVKMPMHGYIWAYPCGDILGTPGSLQAVQTGANIAYVFTSDQQ